MTPAAQALLPICFLGGWISGFGGYGYPEEDIYLPRNKVAATLLEDVQLGQEQDCHQFGEGYTSLYPGIQGAGASDQRVSPTVGRRRQAKPIQVSVPGGLQTPSTPPPPLHHPNPTTTQAQMVEASAGTLNTTKAKGGDTKAQKG